MFGKKPADSWKNQTYWHKYHFIRDLVEARRIKVVYCASENMIVDILTKGICINQFEMLLQLAGIAEGTSTDWNWEGVLQFHSVT